MGHERGIVTGLSSDLKLLKLHERHEIFQISHGRQWRAALPETEEGHNRRNGPLLHSFLPGRILWPPLQGDEAQAEHGLAEPQRHRRNGQTGHWNVGCRIPKRSNLCRQGSPEVF